MLVPTRKKGPRIQHESTSPLPASEPGLTGRRFGLSRALRPGAFLVIGGISAVVQLLLLAVMKERTDLGAWSNAMAFLGAAQLNFFLNYAFTWGDRRSKRVVAVARQLAGFNVLVGIALPVNQGIYLLADMVVPYLLAGAIGILATTLAKYLVADRWIFPRRRRSHVHGTESVRR